MNCIYNRLYSTVYIPYLKKEIQMYIHSYFIYQLVKVLWKPPLSALQLIVTPVKPFYTLFLNFITGLLISAECDTLLTVINKFIKFIHLVVS